MKKKLIIVTLVVLSLFACGCAKTIKLTDDENYQIAEYAAELLLKYGTKLDLKYYFEDETTATTVEDITEVSTEATTEEQVADVNTPTDAQKPDSNATDNQGKPDKPDKPDSSTNVSEAPLQETETISGVEATANKDFDIGKFVGEENLSIKYSYYMLLDRYPSYDQDGIYIEIEAPKGYKLLVMKFNVENTVNESHAVDLYNKDINYRLIVDNNKAAKQMLTILIDDLYTYKKTMEPSMFEEDVLLFQVSDDVASTMKDIKLEVNYNGDKAVLQLQ